MKTNEKINRREALKRLGLIAAGAAAVTSGVAPLTSCAEAKRRVILYFTATGNSLDIARRLADESTELLSIPQLFAQNRFEIEADEIGIVYPIYGYMPPYMVRKFIERAHLVADYKFAVLTYGSQHGSAVEIWDEISAAAGNAFDYIETIVTVDNWLPAFDMTEQIKIEKHIPENVERISADIAARRRWHAPVTDEDRAQYRSFMDFAGLDPRYGFIKRCDRCFEVGDNCIECGICTYVCPRGNFTLRKDGSKKATMFGHCEMCLACIHACPPRAIRFAAGSDDPLLSRGEANPNVRYRNENVSLADLKRANRQPKRLTPGTRSKKESL